MLRKRLLQGLAVVVSVVGTGCLLTRPYLRPEHAGCYAVSTDAPIPPFLSRRPPVLPAFVQLDTANYGQVYAPSRWSLGAGPGLRFVTMSLWRPAPGFRGDAMIMPRDQGPLPSDSLVLTVNDAISDATFSLEKRGAGWVGRLAQPDTRVFATLTPIACPPEPMTLGPVRREHR